MRRIDGSEWKNLLPFLYRNREFNMFIIGDIENTSSDSDNLEIFLDGDFDSPRGILLRYYKFLILSDGAGMNFEQAAEVVRRFEQAMMLSGTISGIDRITPYLQDIREEEETLHFAVLREPNLDAARFEVRRATTEDAEKLLVFLFSIEEFHATDEESFMATLKDGSTRRYIIEDQGKILATAASTSESSDMAMIIGVATGKDFRGRGLASAVVSRLCEDLLAEGRTPCLLYDNPEAGRIYNRLGFREIGKLKTLRFRKR
ncbi:MULTISPECIES: GNAT family N-acetyltransferase [unclassified Mesotoga]|uniref:GNAT family N-acetyltransferase n=1 Tax=unclassified Mesotoga TaxID=1184398 RepID=UPI000DA6695C|nr:MULTISPECIES: GNAT family N-acetyltransferase [unclassified Mesotoga]PZC52055.1 acetyltransferase [Mesotoga sp. TolDC]